MGFDSHSDKKSESSKEECRRNQVIIFAEAGTAYRPGEAKGSCGVTETQGLKGSKTLVFGALRRKCDLSWASVD